jgi:putative transposase
MTNQFNMDEAIKALRKGKDLTGKGGVLTPLIKQLTETALTAERDQYLRQDVGQNRRNGKTSKVSKPTVAPSS